MNISAKMTVIFAAIFAVVCFGVAITGLSSLGDIADPAQKSDAWGFALFWGFLGMVAVVCGAAAVWIVKTHKEDA